MTVADTSPPRVLHVVGAVLAPSETFLQRRLVGGCYESAVLTWRRVRGGLACPCPVRLIWPDKDVEWARQLPRAAALVRRTSIAHAIWSARPAVVHAHFGPVGAVVARACELLRLPLVTSFYGYDVGLVGRDSLRARRMQALFATGAAFTAEGPALARRLMEIGAPAHAVKLLPLCLPDWALARPERQVDLTAPELQLLQVARFCEKKGVDITLRALAAARARGIPARLTLVGDGLLRPALERLAGELALGDAVTWTGFRPYSELPELLARAHVFIQPSRTAADGDTEGGHPTTLIEALAQEVPVIGTRHADIPSVVRHEETGLVCPENDADAVAAAIARLHGARDLLARMAARARTFTLARHDPERMRRLRERIYREARAGAGAGAAATAAA